MIRQITISAWAAAILVQALILALLVRRGHFRRLPLFTAWLTFDLIRWSIIFAIYINAFRTNKYAVIFAWTEPLDMMLLAVAGLEAAGPAAFGWGLSVALAVGIVKDFPITDLPLRIQFMTRSLIAGAVASSLTIRSTLLVLNREAPGWHRMIFLLFCMIDLTAYFRVVTMWPKLDRDATQAFVMVGQLCCLIAWAGYFRKHRGIKLS